MSEVFSADLGNDKDRQVCCSPGLLPCRLDALQSALRAATDPGYLAFGNRLQPGIDNRIGVRMPVIRRLAKRVLKENPCDFLQEALSCRDWLGTQEAVMLTGIVLAGAKLTLTERLGYLQKLLPYLDGWATVDLMGGELKQFREASSVTDDFLMSLLESNRPMKIRLGLVLLLKQRATADWLPKSLATLERTGACRMSTDYLVSMGLAWCWATLYATDPVLVAQRLEQVVTAGRMDSETLARTLQKVRDSRRITSVEKVALTARFAGWLASSRSKLA